MLTGIGQQLGALEQHGRCVLVVQRKLQVVRIDRTPLQRKRTCHASSALLSFARRMERTMQSKRRLLDGSKQKAKGMYLCLL